MANRIIEQGPDTRAQGVRALRWVMPLPGEDAEAVIDAALLAEIDAKTKDTHQ